MTSVSISTKYTSKRAICSHPGQNVFRDILNNPELCLSTACRMEVEMEMCEKAQECSYPGRVNGCVGLPSHTVPVFSGSMTVAQAAGRKNAVA